MINTSYSNYNYTISYQKPQSYMKELGGTAVMTEKSDTDNDVYRNASTKAVLAAKVERYSQGTFDLSLLVAGGNSESYFKGTMSNSRDVDYFNVDATSQILSRRPVLVKMEMPEGADYDLAVYDSQGNQVGIATANEDGTKTLTIPCDWSSSKNFVIKICQHDSEKSVEGTYKLTFSQGEMPQETKDWMTNRKPTGTMSGEQNLPDYMIKEKREEKNAKGMEALHKAQYDALPEELKYTGKLSASELLQKQMKGEVLSEAEKAYIAIYGNQKETAQADAMEYKQKVEQDFSDYLDSVGLSGKTFQFAITASGEVEISGLAEEQEKLVRDYLEEHQKVFKSIYLQTSEETTNMTDEQYRLAGYVEECNRFLAKISEGQITVDDLSLEQKTEGYYTAGNWIAGLPSSVEQDVNHANSAGQYYEYKEMLNSILEYKRLNGEVPQYHVSYAWNGRRLSELEE